MTYQDQLHLQRHGQYERRFSLAFQRVLKQNYYQIARNLEYGLPLDQIDSEPMQRVYTRLYLSIMASEGVLIWNELVAPLTGQEIKTKDVFDEVASIYSPDKISEMKPFWNRLMTGFLNTYIIQRVTEVMGTTIKRVTEFIERGRNDGLTNKELARILRADARARELRANTIARTEATNAMSKAQILALESSKLNWQKSWNPIRDDRTRDAHFVMDNTNWIGIKDNFIVGGYLMAYPGDLTQGAVIGQAINCRCRLAFRLAGRQYGFRPVQRRT
jgi:hypothetical protein